MSKLYAIAEISQLLTVVRSQIATFHFSQNCTINAVRFKSDSVNLTGDATFDVNVAGTSLFTDPDDRPKILSGEETGEAPGIAFAYTAFEPITIDLDGVPIGGIGGNLYIEVELEISGSGLEAEEIGDAANALLVVGAGLSKVYDDAGNTLTLAGTPATTSDPGMMSAADKSKLSGIATGATANAADADLRDRSTHTGTQAASTISDLSEAVDDRVNTLIVPGAGLSKTYDDAPGTLTIDGTPATTSAPGTMSAADKTKLNGIATGATANATDADLRDRSTHTGTQAASSISDFSEAVDDRVVSLIVVGSGLTKTYDDAANTLILDAIGGGGGGGLTVEDVDDRMNALLIVGAGLSKTYDDAANTLTLAGTPATTSDPGLMSAADKSKLDGVATGATANSTDASLRDRSTHTGTQAAATISDLSEAVDDRVNALVVAGAGLAKTYDDAAGTLTLDVTGGGALPSVRVYRATAQAIATATETALLFDAERWDTDSMHSTASNTSRLTATTAGTYIISISVSFAGNTTGYRQVSVRLNGTDYIASDNRRPNASASDPVNVSISVVWKMDAGDYVEAMVSHTAGVSLNVTAGAKYTPEFAMALLR
jgi:cell pole-organizing protein PopZ